MKEFAGNPHADPGFWKPATLITQLALEGKTFDDPPGKSPAAKRKTAKKKGGRRG
jgi:hypothetical protein